MSDPGWMADAKCRGLDPDLFHPGRGDTDGTARALAVCADCPVQADCLAYAMSFGGGNFQVSGVWGGTTDRRRRKMRRWARQDAA